MWPALLLKTSNLDTILLIHITTSTTNMPIVKVPPSELMHAGLHFYTPCTEVADMLTNVYSIAIWHYLLSRSPGWIIRRNDIKRRLNIGDVGYKKGMDELKKLGLVMSFTVRDDKGLIIEHKTVCYSLPAEVSERVAEQLKSMRAQIVDNHNVGSPQSGIPASLPIDGVNTNDGLLPKDPWSSDDDRDGDGGFEVFYSAYPKKVGKKDAKKAYGKLKPSPDLLTMILTNLRDRAAAGKETQFYPNPATYLNGERWHDEIIKENNNGQQKLSAPERVRAGIEERQRQRATGSERDGSVVASYE